GGGSEINSCLYHRTPDDILAIWRELYQVRHLETEDLRPHAETCETILGVRLNPGRPPIAAVKMKLGADRMGWKSKEVPRWFKYQETACADGRFSGTRQSMTETLIPNALGSGCRLLTGTRAQRLTKKSGHWQVHAVRAGNSETIEADAVFICGGAVQT